MDVKKFTREQFYQLIWSKPATKLATELGISDVAITKLCRRFNIPKPGVGYWRILESGHRETIPTLPPAGNNISNEIVIYPVEKRAPRLPPQLPKEILDLIECEKLPATRIVAPGDINHAHSVIRQAQKLFKQAEPDNYGRLWFPRFNAQQPAIRLDVSRTALDRALRIFAAIFDAVEAQGS